MSSLPSTRSNSIYCISQRRKAGVTGTFSISPESVRVPYPEFAGLLARKRGTTPVYIVDRNGYRRLVPFPSTFINLFEDSTLDQALLDADMVAEIAEGPALDEGAILIRGISSEAIYLMDQGRKRSITSQEVMEKYGFNEDYVIVVPQILLNAVPTGDVWE
jgi:hypothetical protein